MNITYNSTPYSRERIIIHVSNVQAETLQMVVTDSVFFPSTPIYYLPDNSGNIDLDVTDIVRVDGDIKIILTDGSQTETVHMEIAGDFNPYAFVTPKIDYAEYYAKYKIYHLVPPLRVLADFGIPTLLELYDVNNVNEESPLIEKGRFYDSTGVNLKFFETNNQIQLGLGCEWFEVRHPYTIATEYRHNITPLNERAQYACVQWRGRLGGLKRHTFELRGVEFRSSDKIELQTMNARWNTRKGLEQRATLQIEALTAYDLWYYADIVGSSDVRVALIEDDYNSATETIREECRVEVVTDKIKIPDGDCGGFFDLKIEIILRKYDSN